jgi:ABC-type multidrug transport system permease subunit
MHFVLISALKDLRRMRRDPMALIAWIGGPLLIALLLVAFFGHEDPKPQGLVMIADQDKSLLSAIVMHAYTQDKLGEIFTVQQVPLATGRKRINDGDGSALVIIPKGFSRAVLGRQTAKIQLITNPSQSILPGIVESITSILVDGAWRLQQIAGDDLKQLSADQPPSDETVADSSIRFRHMTEGMRKYIDPPAIKVDVAVVEPNPGRRHINMSAAMFPCMTFMAILFLAAGVAGDIWKEKAAGTMRRVVVTPSSLAGFWGGRILAMMAVFAAVGIVALLAGKVMIRMEIHSAVCAMLWIGAFGATMYMAFVLMHTFFPNQRGAAMLSNLLMMMLGMLGGSFFPFELMPESLEKIGRHLPNGWAILRFRDILNGQVLPSRMLMDFGAVLAVMAILFFVVTRRLRRNFLY